MIVEDDGDVREYAARVLRETGWLVALAADAEGALKIMEHVVVDVLFTDIVLPGPMDGVELARAARRLNPDLKVICTTGFAEVAASERLLEFCVRFLNKPYRPGELTRNISEALVA
jgi:CheY-like chemotaxis protein